MKVEFKCNYCGKSAFRRKGDVNRAIKKGLPLYCDNVCSGLSRQMNLENITHRFCNECETLYTVDNFRTKNKNGRTYVKAKCRKCELISNKRGLDLEKKKSTTRKRESDPEYRKKRNEYGKNWRDKNIHKNRKYHSKFAKNEAEKITDSYILRNHFRGVKKELVPSEIIEAYRLKIKTNRIIKNKTRSV